jgi:hypothetical protein
VSPTSASLIHKYGRPSPIPTTVGIGRKL